MEGRKEERLKEFLGVSNSDSIKENLTQHHETLRKIKRKAIFGNRRIVQSNEHEDSKMDEDVEAPQTSQGDIPGAFNEPLPLTSLEFLKKVVFPKYKRKEI